MKIHDPDPRENRRRVEAVRKALGDGVRLMVDVNQKLDVLGNIRQAAALEDLDLVWYEEPVLADDIAALRRGRPRDPDPGRHRREPLHALRVPRAHASGAPPATSCPTSAGPTASARRSRSATSPPPTSSWSRRTSSTSSRCTWRARSANGFLVEYMDWVPPDLFEDVPRPDPADGLFRIPDRPGHGMALAPGAEQKYRLR